MTLTATSASSSGSIQLNNNGLLTLTTSALQTVFFYSFSMAFCLEDLPSYSALAALYERWRLDAVEVRLTPLYTQAQAATVAGNGSIGGFLHSVIDYNDYGIITASQAGVQTIRSRPSYTTTNITDPKPVVFRLKPRIAQSAYAAGFGAYSNSPAQWIDTMSSNTEHYGLKWIFEVADTSAVVQFVNFKMEARYLLSFTDVR